MKALTKAQGTEIASVVNSLQCALMMKEGLESGDPLYHLWSASYYEASLELFDLGIVLPHATDDEGNISRQRLVNRAKENKSRYHELAARTA